ncbi:ligase-associated DNA damage response DEXH box helicase [Niabella ginsengisoli]|uniref:Ligase-associated DNA damage response DEXH box helicase n=1 Tax=Niabella ginsengisoli TaxID=522298 RepID=A0ABS9SM22_9BACT|nr:ligase-associated DNA damage response DEXH box helicase [Niabella ginsengisoli]MCH5599402.1 ligase-associated DNA damage response DEXH box helicase [Niabella ginsengisoli]
MSFIQSTSGYSIVKDWFQSLGNRPFNFQKESWQHFHDGYSGLVIAPTGFGKTFSVFFSVVIHYLNHPKEYGDGLKLIWITPLRSLAKDLGRAMTEALEQIGLDWEVGVRNGDTPVAERQRQTKRMPDVLIITPESLHLLFAQKNNTAYFKYLKCVAVDEWHELLGSKRGVLTELAISRLRYIVPDLRIWGISATIGNIDEALNVLIPYADASKTIVRSKEKKKTEIISIIPDEIEVLPWAGHLGTKMAAQLIPIINESRTTLIFTNTRGQSELWYQVMLTVAPDLAGQLAIHHGSIDMELRNWIEDMLHTGQLKAVICTSSLDLGVDFKPVDTVIQIGSPKGVARFLQRAGRSGHSPFETSKIYFLPTHSLELVEAAALKDAAQKGVIESRVPLVQTFDVLVQYLVTLAVGEGFIENSVYQQVKQTHAFSYIEREEWLWVLRFITQGGDVLTAYEDFQKVIVEDGIYKVKNRRIAMMHRMNLGVIVSDPMLKVKFLSGGYIGMVEEYFVSKLNPGDKFGLAGKILEFVMIKDMTVLVKKSNAKRAITPSWLGGRLPLSSNLSAFLRHKFNEAMHPGTKELELKKLHPLFKQQEKFSHIPKDDEFLVELIQTRDGHHLFMYPFEGRLVHEVMSALVAYRISKVQPISFSMAMNDYGFELLSDQPIPMDKVDLNKILSAENLTEDITRSINAAEMAGRKFRDISVIAGLVIKNYAGKYKTDKNLQSSSGLIFRIFEQYDAQNLLMRQAYEEVFYQQLEEPRLAAALQRIQQSKIVVVNAKAFTPLSFPIKVDSLRQDLSSEELDAKVRKMQEETMKRSKG